MKVRKKRSQAPGAKLHNDQVHAEKQRLRAEALSLRLKGASASQIAKQLGVGTSTAFRYVKDALAAIPALTTKEERAEAIAKRDDAELAEQQRLSAVLAKIRAGGDKLGVRDFTRLHQTATQIRRNIQAISEDKSKLAGHYAPQEHKLDVTVAPAIVTAMSDDELKRIASGDFAPVYGAMNGKLAS